MPQPHTLGLLLLGVAFGSGALGAYLGPDHPPPQLDRSLWSEGVVTTRVRNQRAPMACSMLS